MNLQVTLQYFFEEQPYSLYLLLLLPYLILYCIFVDRLPVLVIMTLLYFKIQNGPLFSHILVILPRFSGQSKLHR